MSKKDKKEIYVVSGRYGDEMKKPAWFKTMKEAKDYVKSKVAAAIREASDDLCESRVNVSNDDAVIRWAKDHDECASYNTKGVYDTCTIGEDWTEYCIFKLTIENANSAFIVSSMYGTTMYTPTVCYTEEEAKSMISADIADCIREGADEELKDDDETFEYAEERDLCRSYNVDGVYDTYTGSEDWTTYRIDRFAA